MGKRKPGAHSGGGAPCLCSMLNDKVVYTESTCKLSFEQDGSTLNPIFDFNHPLYESIEYKTERRKVIGRKTVLTPTSPPFAPIWLNDSVAPPACLRFLEV
jgi:hypothetical protein